MCATFINHAGYNNQKHLQQGKNIDRITNIK